MAFTKAVDLRYLHHVHVCRAHAYSNAGGSCRCLGGAGNSGRERGDERLSMEDEGTRCDMEIVEARNMTSPT